jgi:hypothetical protein
MGPVCGRLEPEATNFTSDIFINITDIVYFLCQKRMYRLRNSTLKAVSHRIRNRTKTIGNLSHHYAQIPVIALTKC